MNWNKRTTASALVTTTALVLSAANYASAAVIAGDVIVIDIGKDTAITTTIGWNNISLPASPNNLWGAGPAASDPFGSAVVLDSSLNRFSDNAETGVSFTVASTGSTGTVGIGGLTAGSVGSSASFTSTGTIPANAQVDTSFINSNVVTFTFGGLNGSLTYNLEILSWTDGASRNAHDITVNGTTISVDPDDTNYVTAFNEISANGSDQIVVSFTTTTGGSDLQHINALELTAVPEPSVAAFASIMLTVGLLRRRRA